VSTQGRSFCFDFFLPVAVFVARLAVAGFRADVVAGLAAGALFVGKGVVRKV
jgi:hypothetical protein